VCFLKKSFPKIVILLIGIVVGLVTSSVFFQTTGLRPFGERDHTPAPTDMAHAELTALAFDVLEYISDSDFEALSRIVHPDFGVVFSPSATINLSTNRRFNAEQISLFGVDSTIYVWGIRNGTGEPIELSPVEYFSQFVFSSDYINAPVIGVDQIIRSGNALENITDEFPGIRFVEFHIPGEERNGQDDLDWSTLRLGFEQYNDRFWLTVIVHSTWTV